MSKEKEKKTLGKLAKRRNILYNQSVPMPYFTTSRLLLRPLQRSDAPILFAYRNDPETARYQNYEELTLSAIEGLIEQHQNDPFPADKNCRYGVALKDDSLIGDIAYFYNLKDECITLGISIAPAFQRKGYAFEILQNAIKKIQETYPALDIVALVEKANVPSQKLFEKLAFHNEGYAKSVDSFVYVISRLAK